MACCLGCAPSASKRGTLRPMRSHVLFFTVLALVLAAAAACSSSSAGGAVGAPDAAPAWAPDGPDTDTWASWGLNFFSTYCVECHSASDPQGLNFGVQAIVAANRDA